MKPSATAVADQEKQQAHAALRAGRGDLAIRHMQRACELVPGSSALRFETGCLLAHVGRATEALDHFQASVELQPDFAEGWHFIGLTLARAGRAAEALAPLRRAHGLDPGNIRVLERLAQLEFDIGDPADALPLWRALAANRPGDPAIELKLGEVLARLDQAEAASALYAKALEREPASAELWMAFAQAEEICGRRDGAETAYERALSLRPGWAFPLAGLLGLRRGQAPEPRIAEAQAVLADPARPDDERALVGYELGKVYDGRGDYPQAMQAWHAANAARRRAQGEPDVEDLARRVDASLAVFDRALFERAAGTGNPDERPVFIVGMPRSGTTLLEQMLAAHPRVHGAGELPDVSLIARALPSRRGRPQQWPHILEDITLESVPAAAQRYLAAALRQAPADTARVIDKYPMNYYLLGLVALMFPKARVIWCRRDPRDVAISIYGENFALAERLATRLDGIGHLVRLQSRMMRHWQSVLSLPILEVHYEEVAADTEAQARRALDFLGLDWDPACLDFHRSERGVQTPSRWQVRQPVHTRSIGRWRHYASELGPLLDVLGDAPGDA
ncbi:tetratricopeptide repeat-containing sulfotransferase family protein [Arenimonas donghaensis]|uniref:Uncharacterized protein n=1 Tax=Arenimonas donghaensis DSM 18148 = HO3-R19 TaxID=1121014 RepID=A0A087MI82_9GAMM|nr:tetratricopeptide repeat-containing sulfotransferase family protein [Arenimonas donghaensis]KFL36585.1 hypothetical protein N788_02965 [Arenimonas donghaensis DSM 18148 = HO3-R19]